MIVHPIYLITLALPFIGLVAAYDSCAFGELRCTANAKSFDVCNAQKVFDTKKRPCEACKQLDGFSPSGVACNAFSLASGDKPDEEVWFPGFRRINNVTGSFFGEGQYTKMEDSSDGKWVWAGFNDDYGDKPFAIVEMPPLNMGMFVNVAHCFKVEVLALDNKRNTFRGVAEGEQFVYSENNTPEDPSENHRFNYTDDEWLKLGLYRFVVSVTC